MCVGFYCLHVFLVNEHNIVEYCFMYTVCAWVCEYLDAAADCDHRRLPGRGGDGNGEHLVVKAIAISIINDKVEDVGDGLAARL